MSKCSEIRDFLGDYAFEVEYSEDNKFTMFFNSERNARTVKRCIELDDSVPNVATAVDFVEVVRCQDCKLWHSSHCTFAKRSVETLPRENDYCSRGERRENATS